MSEDVQVGELAVVLVSPQLPENVGAVARAMANFGLSEMRLVTPCPDWSGARAHAPASGAGFLIDNASVFSTVSEAVADLHVVYSSTARPRDMRKTVVPVGEAMETAHRHVASGKKVGVLFGRERWGLTNDEVSLSDAIFLLPADPDFSSFNLAQAVLLVGYEWFRASGKKGGRPASSSEKLLEERGGLATREDLEHLFQHLETELSRTGFFFPVERRPLMLRNLRSIFYRADLDRRDISTLHGVIKALVASSNSPKIS